MARAQPIDDLFGHVPQRTSAPQAAAAPHREKAGESLYPCPPGGHTADSIRGLLTGIIAEARALTVLDWDPSKLRSYTAMSLYMAEWLKNGEGDRLLAELKAEMDRLQAPVELVAPNWRKLWKLDG